MQRTTLIISLCFTIAVLFGQEKGTTNYQEALENAKNEGQVLVIQFSGSDWCSPCIRLEEQILNTAAFQAYQEKFVWLKADFPRKKANRLTEEQQIHNDALAERYNSKGSFPLLVFINNEEKVLGSIGYQPKSPEEYIVLIEKILSN